MTVIDIRSIFSDRHIQIVDVNASYIYYAEEKNQDGQNELFLLEYNRKTRKERLVMNYQLDDPTFVHHIYAFEKTIVLVLENGSNSFWLIELDKKSGGELNRRKLVCTGSFKECMMPDNDHLLIYMAEDAANTEVFKKYKELTGSECLCYLYHISANRKFFVNAPLISRIGCQNIKPIEANGERYLVLADPYCEEGLKEHYYSEQRWISADVRDNIWLCKTTDLEQDIEDGKDSITKKCIASADIKALVRYMGINGEKVYFRAKEFRSSTEKICSYDLTDGTLSVELTPEKPKKKNIFYLIEDDPYKTFTVTVGEEKTHIRGLINSEADISYDNSLGSLMTCIENRYCITKKTIFSEESKREFTYYYLYDAETGKYESYECSCMIKGNTMLLF